jgi:hypothetical protein
MLKRKISPVGEGEAMGPAKKNYTLDMVSHKSLEASAEAKGEGKYINVGRTDPDVFTS